MQSIGIVSEKSGIPIATLKAYDRDGLFGELPRVSGVRMFGDKQIEALRIIECLKASGLNMEQIKRLMQSQTSAEDKLRLFNHQKDLVEKQMKELEKTRDMLKFQCWYYEQAVKDGDDSKVAAMDPSEYPQEIREIYEKTRE